MPRQRRDRATMTHRYSAPGTYPVTAYIFGASGYIDSIETDVEVVENDDGEVPSPNPNPEDFPGNISAPLPVDDAEDVRVPEPEDRLNLAVERLNRGVIAGQVGKALDQHFTSGALVTG